MLGGQRQFDRNRVVSDELRGTQYDAAQFTLATATTDYDTKTNEADMFDVLKLWMQFEFWADQNITLKLNSADNKGIVIESGQVWTQKVLEVTNIFLTNTSGETANINFIGVHKGV